MNIITLNDNGIVISAKNVGDNYVMQENEFVTDDVMSEKLGMIYDPDNNAYSEPEIEE